MKAKKPFITRDAYYGFNSDRVFRGNIKYLVPKNDNLRREIAKLYVENEEGVSN